MPTPDQPTTPQAPIQGRDGDVLCQACGSNSLEPCRRDAGKECGWPEWSRRHA